MTPDISDERLAVILSYPLCRLADTVSADVRTLLLELQARRKADAERPKEWAQRIKGSTNPVPYVVGELTAKNVAAKYPELFTATWRYAASEWFDWQDAPRGGAEI